LHAVAAEQLLRITVHFLHQRQKCGHIMGLSRRDDEPDRQAFRVSAFVDLGRVADARTAERVALGSLFPPPAPIWTEFKGNRGTNSKPLPGPRQVYGFLTTEANVVVKPIIPCRRS
jgi:hypothetical protein